MMRIAILTTDNRDTHRRYNLPTPYFGPAIEALLQGFRRRSEIEVHVLSCSQQPMAAPEKLADNILFHVLHVPKMGWLRTAYQGCIRAVRKRLQQIQPDVVHGQGTERECALSAVLSGFPNIVTIHGNVRSIARSTKASFGTFWWWSAWLEHFILPRTLGVLCNSRYTESVVQSRAKQTWRVPNAVRTEFFTTPLNTRRQSQKPVLLNIGTVSELKRQIALLEVGQELHRSGYSFELHFIGPADTRDKYVSDFLNRIESGEKHDFARYLGTKSLPELIQALDAADALVHVPCEEAFGLVAAEALARNLKLFGTSIGGLTDIADAVEGAELFELDDSDALGGAISRWLVNGCPQPSSAAGVMQQRYHPSVIAARHAEIYEQIASQQ